MGPDVVFIRVTDGDKNIPLGKKKKRVKIRKSHKASSDRVFIPKSYHITGGGELKSLTDEQQMN